MNRHAVPLVWCILLVVAAWVMFDIVREADRPAPTPVPTLARPVYPASSRGGERPAVLVVGAMGRATATASPTATKVTVAKPEPVSLGVFKITGYSNGPGNGVDGRGITYSGERTRWGVVAVDPAIIPLHTRLLIEGFDGTTFDAKDTGGLVKGRIIDVFHEDNSEAMAWGVREANVWRLSN